MLHVWSDERKSRLESSIFYPAGAVIIDITCHSDRSAPPGGSVEIEGPVFRSVCQVLSRVDPSWIQRLDQCDILFAPPVLELVFTANRVVDVMEAFKVDEAIDLVLCGKSRRKSTRCAD